MTVTFQCHKKYTIKKFEVCNGGMTNQSLSPACYTSIYLHAHGSNMESVQIACKHTNWLFVKAYLLSNMRFSLLLCSLISALCSSNPYSLQRKAAELRSHSLGKYGLNAAVFQSVISHGCIQNGDAVRRLNC